MNKIIAVFLSLVMIVGAVPAIAYAADTVDSGTCGDYVTWTLDSDGALTISGSGDMASYSSYSDVPWYSKRSDILSVAIEDGVTSIGSDAFVY